MIGRYCVFRQHEHTFGSDERWPDGQAVTAERATTEVLFYGVYGNLLYRAEAAAEGEASFSFVGVLFDEARVAFVRIRTGNALPGADDNRRHDVVMMDDFIYGEPQAVLGPRQEGRGTGIEIVTPWFPGRRPGNPARLSPRSRRRAAVGQ